MNQDDYLNQLGITQYQLVRPARLNGELALQIEPATRLIVVATTSPHEAIFSDILAAIKLTPEQVQVINQNQVIMLPPTLTCVVWFIDSESVNHNLTGPIIHTVALDVLAKTPLLKRKLWRQLCQYEHSFQTHT